MATKTGEECGIPAFVPKIGEFYWDTDTNKKFQIANVLQVRCYITAGNEWKYSFLVENTRNPETWWITEASPKAKHGHRWELQ